MNDFRSSLFSRSRCWLSLRDVMVRSAHLAFSPMRFTAQFDFVIQDRYSYEKIHNALLGTAGWADLSTRHHIKHCLIDRSMPGKNCHLFLSRFSQWIQLPETTLFEISFWATLKYSSNPIWRLKSKMAAKLPGIVTFWSSLCFKKSKKLLIMVFNGKVR